MKFFAIFAAVVAVALARPGTSTWTLEELSNALQNPNVDPAFVPILEHALNEIMTALYNGEQVESVFVPLPADIAVVPSPVVPAPVVPSPAASGPLVQIVVNVKSQQQVAEVPAVVPTPVLVEEAAEEAIEEPVVIVPEPIIVNPIDVIAVNPVDTWGPVGPMPVIDSGDVGPLFLTGNLYFAISVKNTAKMKFFAIFAAVVAVALARPGTSTWTLQEISDALQNPNVDPAFVPILEHALNEIMTALYNGEQLESVFVPLPADIAVVPSPVVPAPVVPSPAASGPLVQIVVNVKSQQQVAEAPAVVPTPVLVEEAAVEAIEEPVVIVPEPIIVNPIDVIAVNPVDTWGPVGPMPVIDSGDVGPLRNDILPQEGFIDLTDSETRLLIGIFYFSISVKNTAKMKFFAIFAAVVAVALARPGTSTWTLEELSNALQNPNVDPALVPILEHALNEIMTALYNGEQVESVFVPLPADIAVVPSPVVPAPVVPSPAASGPLVQIVVNVKSQQQVAEAPAVDPTPVLVEEAAEEAIEEPVDVVPEPIIVNPVDVIAVNPIDIGAPAKPCVMEH
ncbi:calphotin-like [Vanessa cardui]|uniref:calphotin-like n=1 Tax=Vanessa cardui TaxID=171605 RepID=UPI001F133605|nr:calphotin-like [Vanessa cardui]